jgi:hypothetical protein
MPSNSKLVSFSNAIKNNCGHLHDGQKCGKRVPRNVLTHERTHILRNMHVFMSL